MGSGFYEQTILDVLQGTDYVTHLRRRVQDISMIVSHAQNTSKDKGEGTLSAPKRIQT